MNLAEKESCTGCGACAYVCPKKCISFRNDEAYDITYPVIDEEQCISCGKCQKFCPALNPVDGVFPSCAYAAWSADSEERRTSASGGIATEIYKHALNKGWSIVGASFCEDFKVHLELADSLGATDKFKNSKYVFCYTDNIFHEIDHKLKNGIKIAVVALPCQIAAIRKIFNDNLDNLLLVDLVCHGTMPYEYLKQYIGYMEKLYNKKIMRLSFRDPAKGTENYALSLFDEENICFHSCSSFADIYQFAYHCMVAYRENCYHCRYANSSRVSDITLSDYKGLGSCSPCNFSEKKVSSILINSAKGGKFIEELIDDKSIIVEKRPIGEPIRGDSQLRHPSVKSFSRRLWERKYQGNFVYATQYVYNVSKLRDFFLWIYHLPNRIFRKLYRILSL